MWISKKKYEELIKRINTIEEKTSKFTPYGLKWFDQCCDYMLRHALTNEV